MVTLNGKFPSPRIIAKPFETDLLVISPRQTMNVLLKTKANPATTTFAMATIPYFTGQGTFDNSTIAGILVYAKSSTKTTALPPLPPINSTSFVANFTRKLRSLANSTIPQMVDKNFFFTIGLGSYPCPKNQTCQWLNGTEFAASVNNVSFNLPTIALLQAYYSKNSNGVYTTNFPSFPLVPFNYTETPSNNTMVANVTKVVVLPFNATVEPVKRH